MSVESFAPTGGSLRNGNGAPSRQVRERLSRSHGYLGVARDGVCGPVETPLFPPDQSEPDFLVLRVPDGAGCRYPLVSFALVEWVDPDRELVFLRASRTEVSRLPDSAPLVA